MCHLLGVKHYQASLKVGLEPSADAVKVENK